ncbi:MAG: cysteine hydrolase [Herbaspirillum sp.]|nr:cysteine hydrolase [Herbaspirillum sp.]
MAIDTLIPARTAILFFDMLNGHIKKNDPKTQARYQPVIAAASQVLQAARANQMMVAYAAANHRADNATSAHTIRDTDGRLNPIPVDQKPDLKAVLDGGTWEAAVIDELAPMPEDYVVPKYRWSAFYQTYLDLALRARKIDTIIIAGGSTDVGVASTAYSARDMDYNLVFVSDASSSPETDNHDQFMRRIFPRMGRVRTAAQVIEMLKNGAAK